MKKNQNQADGSDNLELRFRELMEQGHFKSNKSHFFLACSGGLDSVVLAHLLSRNGIPFAVLHCNFQLRGEESNRDETFVRELASNLGVECLVKSFDTVKEMEDRKLGVQETARLLRYNWFHEVMELADPSRKKAFVLTAHHADDQVETIAMNFFRGTGIGGLTGMSYQQGQLLRPLLGFSKEELFDYASQNGLTWVEDSSNASSDYTRNLFRNEILPLVKSVFPAYANNVNANAIRLREVETVYRIQMDKILKRLLEKQGHSTAVAVNKLKACIPLDTVLHELFKPYGFTAHQVGEIKKLFDAPTGKFICSSTHRVLRNRGWLLIDPLSIVDKQIVVIDNLEQSASFQLGLMEFFQTNPPERYPTEMNQVWVDIQQLDFPLIIRPCKKGDYFYPIGMPKKKKISRFLTDLKLSLTEKENQWVLESNKRIVWVIGRRLDDRFKLKPGSSALKVVFTNYMN